MVEVLDKLKTHNKNKNKTKLHIKNKHNNDAMGATLFVL